MINTGDSTFAVDVGDQFRGLEKLVIKRQFCLPHTGPVALQGREKIGKGDCSQNNSDQKNTNRLHALLTLYPTPRTV